MIEQFMMKIIELSETVARIDERIKTSSEKQEEVVTEVKDVKAKVESIEEKVDSVDSRLKIIENRKTLLQYTGIIIKYCWQSKPIRYAMFVCLPVIFNFVLASFGIVIPAEILSTLKTLATGSL